MVLTVPVRPGRERCLGEEIWTRTPRQINLMLAVAFPDVAVLLTLTYRRLGDVSACRRE